MQTAVIAIPHSHTWLWTQTCLAALQRNPPIVEGIETQIVLVDNAWDWSPAIRAVTETPLKEDVTVVSNLRPNKYHASGLDHILDLYEPDWFMALETDVLVLRPDWLAWFIGQMRVSDYAVGHWHHEQFVNPSCTLYRGEVLRQMRHWCRENTSREMRWGQRFDQVEMLSPDMYESIRGPFADKRGWPEGTQLVQPPTGQVKGPGWYEPGQMLHHWAVEAGWGYTVCRTATTERVPGLPTQTLYGWEGDAPQEDIAPEALFDSGAVSVHLWGGTRALDIIKHPVECQFVRKNTPFWLEREARFWKAIVPADVQEATIPLIQKWGFHVKGQGTPDVTDRDREAAAMVTECYRRGGVPL